MNKKQLIVAWVVGISISLACILMPYTIDFKKGIFDNTSWPSRLTGYKYGVFIEGHTTQELRRPVITYNRLLGRVFPILILGGLLIYTLRDKKK